MTLNPEVLVKSFHVQAKLIVLIPVLILGRLTYGDPFLLILARFHFFHQGTHSRKPFP